MQSPLQRYQHDVSQPGFVEDAEQRRAVMELQRIFEQLTSSSSAVPQPTSNAGFGGWMRARRVRTLTPSIQGLYLWGGVGRGKTYLVDVFHESLPFENKMRTHFHRFMQRIHAELKTLSGRQDPLLIVADRLASEMRVLCFDEFHVSDITDAMLLGRLLEALFTRGVVLVTTSNIVPDDLYKDGLQRQRFLPAIAAIKANTTVMQLAGAQDFRLRALEQAEIYYHPADTAAEQNLQQAFLGLSGRTPRAGSLDVLGRSIDYRARAEGIVWFDFPAICDGPRGAADYIEVAREFHSVLLSNVPTFGSSDNDRAARFIAMVDEFYDRSVNLLITAAVAPVDLYQTGRHEFPFRRTVSRLIEMGSDEYLHRPHLPV